MPRPLLLVAVLLSACATSPTPIPVHGATPGHKCNADGAARFIGQVATNGIGSDILRATHSAVLRWAPPGTMLTMDYSEGRVTVHLDAANKVTDIKCG